MKRRGPTAAELSLVSCRSCRLVCRAPQGRAGAVCPRCGARVHRRKPESLSRTWALVVAAAILYVPANVLPITHTASLTVRQSDTILSGVIYFMTTGSWFVAVVIFVASILIPLLKLLTLIFLLVSIQVGSRWRPLERSHLYRLTEAVGRWSMVDIYVVTILVALVKLGAVAHIEAGPGAVFFAAVVVITMLAAMSFDPRLIWDAAEQGS
jgi:paraquat-inducible protein A